MKTVVLFVIAATMLVGCVARDVVLVQEPPTYTTGETFNGLFTTISGQHYILRQEAIATGGFRHPEVRTRIIGVNGGVLIETTRDPTTGLIRFRNGNMQGRFIGTTCTPKTMYPIRLGMELECLDTVEVNNKRLTQRTRFRFDTLIRKQNETVEAFCATREESLGSRYTEARICFSADGKWVRSLEIKRSEERTVI